MSHARRPTLPMPNKSEINALITFLAANVAVSKEDGDRHKAECYEALLDTTKALAERAVDLSGITRVVVVTDAGGRVYDHSALYTDGCAADVQDDGRTLKLYPTPKAGWL